MSLLQVAEGFVDSAEYRGGRCKQGAAPDSIHWPKKTEINSLRYTIPSSKCKPWFVPFLAGYWRDSILLEGEWTAAWRNVPAHVSEWWKVTRGVCPSPHRGAGHWSTREWHSPEFARKKCVDQQSACRAISKTHCVLVIVYIWQRLQPVYVEIYSGICNLW